MRSSQPLPASPSISLSSLAWSSPSLGGKPASMETPTPLSAQPHDPIEMELLPVPSRFSVPINSMTFFMAPFRVGGYPNPAQFDYMREFHAMRERVKQLEVENTKLESECNTLREVLNYKGPAIDPTLSGPREMYPKIKFWTSNDYIRWLDLPNAQVAHRGKIPYLEETNGAPILSAKGLRMFEIAFELDGTNLSLQSWAIFHPHVEKEYPLFKLAEGGWKLDRMERDSYSTWRKYYLNEQGQLISKSERHKRKLPKSEESKPMFSPKRQRMEESDAVQLEDPKYDSESTLALTSSALTSSASTSSASTSSASTSSSSTPSSSTPSSLTSTYGQAVFAQATSFAPRTSSTLPSPSSFAPQSGRLLGMQVEHKDEHMPAASCNIPEAPQSASEDIVKPDDPLNSLAHVAAEINVDFEIPSVPKPSELSDHMNSEVHSATPVNVIPPSESTVSIPSVSKSIPTNPSTSTALKKVTKMRPGSGRNGRNLCAHRWLKVFKDSSSGTTVEFKRYYGSLSKEQVEAYDREANGLVAKNAWNKDAFNGKIY